MVIFLLLVAVVTGYHLDSHIAKETNRNIHRWNVCVRSGTIFHAQTGLDSMSIEDNPLIVETRRAESMKETVFNFLVDEAEYLGSTDWDVSEISNKRDSICFKCTSSSRDAKSLFVKHSQQPRSEVHNRLRYEFEGMRVFSKYSPKEVSEILLYNDEKQILVTEWLDSYRPLSRYFEFSPALVAANAQSGVSFRHVTLPVLEVDSDTCRAMGTIMGRSHARTYRRILTTEKYSQLMDRFENKEMIDLWDKTLFAGTLDRLKRPPLDAVGEILESYNRFDELKSYGGSGENLDPNEELRTGHLSLAVEMLQKTFLQNKECLVHADLRCSNILMLEDEFERMNNPSQRSGDRRSRAFKGHSDASRRRGAVSGVMATIDSYKSAFRVQLGGTSGAGGAIREIQRQRQIQNELRELNGQSSDKSIFEGVKDTFQNMDSQPIDVEEILSQILRDAMGYMGLYCIFMLLKEGGKGMDDFDDIGCIESISLKNMPELLWGDRIGRASFVRQRQTEMSVLAVLTYLDSVISSEYDSILSDEENGGSNTRKTKKASNVITAQSFSSIFLADDKISSSNHMTEFWY